MNSYELSRNWFDWCFENPDKISPSHTALYFFAIEHCNRLGWKEKFGFPSQMAMEALGIKNWRTYSKILNDLIDWKFIKLIEKSKNQYSSNIIAIVNFTKATTKALDKAMQKHSTKQRQSIVSINKQETNNNITNKQIPTFEEFKAYALEKEHNIDIKALNNKYDAWVVNNWKDGNDKKITNWKSKLLNTLKYIDKHEQNKQINGHKYLTRSEKERRHVNPDWTYIHYKDTYKKVHTDDKGDYIDINNEKIYL